MKNPYHEKPSPDMRIVASTTSVHEEPTHICTLIILRSGPHVCGALMSTDQLQLRKSKQSRRSEVDLKILYLPKENYFLNLKRSGVGGVFLLSESASYVLG